MSESNAEETNKVLDGSMAIANTTIVLFIVCFILSFFGKSKFSMITGIVMVLCGIIASIFCMIHFSFPGVAAGVLFIISGALSITNRKKVAA